MASFKYILEVDNQRHSLEIQAKPIWAFYPLPYWKDVTILLDGMIIGSIATNKELGDGREFRIGNNSILKVRNINNFTTDEWVVQIDGQPIQGTLAHPSKYLESALVFFFTTAVYNLIMGLIAQIWNIDFIKEIGWGFLSSWIGSIYLIKTLGFGIGSIIWGSLSAMACIFIRRTPLVTLSFVAAISLLDTSTIFFSLSPPLRQNLPILIIFILFRLCIPIGSVRAFKATYQFRQREPK